MGESSKIEWTDATWNPTRGCSRVSPGCDNCYAMRQDISEEDAKAEGVTPLASIGESQPILDTPRRGRTHGTHPHVLAFGVLWDTLNGKRPGCAWQDNQIGRASCRERVVIYGAVGSVGKEL